MYMGDQNISNKASLSTVVHVSPYTKATDFNTVAINLQKEMHRRRYVRNANTYYNEITAKLNATGAASAPAVVRTAATVSILNKADISVQVDKVGWTGQNRTWMPTIALAYTLSNALQFCTTITAALKLDVQDKAGVGHDSGTSPNFRYRGRIPIGFLKEFTEKTATLASKRMSGVPGANADSSKLSSIKSPEVGPSSAENHGCQTGCTGFCSGSCINFCNGCTGCTATCGYGCQYGCNTACDGTHAKQTGDCGGCDGYCHGTASGGCGNSCSTTCSNDCENICRGGCGSNCTGTCVDTAGAVTTAGYAVGGAQQW